MNSIFHRTSIRKYQDRPVEPEKIETMLRAAFAAPSTKNQQPWEYYAVTNRDMISKLSKSTRYAGCAAKAPLVFVACCRKSAPAQDFALLDMSASVENLLLEADELGLGAVWLGVAPGRENMDSVANAIGLPDSLEAFAMIACGYPLEERRQQDRYQEERVHYLK